MNSTSDFVKPALLFVGVVLVSAMSFLAGLLLASRFGSQPTVIEQISGSVDYPILTEVQGLIDSDFLGEIPDQTQQEYGMIRGMLTELGDPYTVFNEPVQAELNSDNLSGKFGGIGARLNFNEDGTAIIDPFRESPAARAGLVTGDMLIGVDGILLTPAMTPDDTVAMIRGEAGTVVMLVIQKEDGTQVEVSIEREEFEIPSVEWRMLDNTDIGILDIGRFSDRTSAEAEQGINELIAEGATKLIVDLRDNGGGLLNASVDVASHFLDGGPILLEEKRGAEDENIFEARGGGPALEIPVVVLMNGGTASASEILAGALRDRDRAALIGTTSFGKGSVQLVYQLSDGSSLNVTNAKWFTPKRAVIDGTGLAPNIVVDPGAGGSDLAQGDPWLEQAIQYFNNNS